MKELIGKRIKKMYRIGDQITIFETDTGERIAYETYGDCCSTSFFSHVSNLKSLLGQVVTTVEERQEFSEEDQKKAEAEGNYDCLSLYGYLIRTKKGTCEIEFRNDSNGYYGGWCSLINSFDSSEMKEVKKDI